MKTSLKGIVFVLFVFFLVLFSSCSFQIPNLPSTNQKNVKKIEYGMDMTLSGQTSGLVPGENVSLNFHIINHMAYVPESVIFTSSPISSDVFSKSPSDSSINSQIQTSLNSLKGVKTKANDLLNIYFDYPFTVSDSLNVKSYQVMFYLFYFVKYDNSLIVHWPGKGDQGKTFFLSVVRNNEPIQPIKAVESVGRKNIYLKFTLKNMKNGQFYYKKGLTKAEALFDDSLYNNIGFSVENEGKVIPCDVGYFDKGMANVVCQMPYQPDKYGSQKQVQVKMNYVYLLTKNTLFSFNLIQ